MANLVHGMKNWLAYSTMDEDEWDTMRKVYLEEEVRRLFGQVSEGLGPAIESTELGQVSVPVRSGTLRRVKHLSGRVFISRDKYEDGDQFKVHLMVSDDRSEDHEAWEPLCTWTFESLSEVADFVTPPSAESAS